MLKILDVIKLAVLIILLSLFFSIKAKAAEEIDESDDEWADNEWSDDWAEENLDWQWSGFFEIAYGSRLQTDPVFVFRKDSKQTLNEIRSHFETDYSGDEFSFALKADGWIDDVTRDLSVDVRELSTSFSVLGNTDFKVGRQISTWGTGDLLFLNDLFPKDWQSFFSGREDTYLKAPANAIRLTSYFDAVNVDIVWTPEFTPDRYIDGERFSFFSPLTGQQVGGSDLIDPIKPDTNFGNSEIAARLYKNIKGTEYAMYLYKGFDKQPLGLTNTLTATFNRRNVYGASVRGTIDEALYNVEIAYHDSKDDAEGSDPLIQNSQWRFLIGYETELLTNLSWSAQYYLEWTDDYQELIANSPFPQLETKERRQLISNRITYRTLQDKLTWSLFVFYSPTDDDSYWRPNLSYRYSDQWTFTFAANIFDGQRSETFFGQFEDATNAYLRVRYNF